MNMMGRGRAAVDGGDRKSVVSERRGRVAVKSCRIITNKHCKRHDPVTAASFGIRSFDPAVSTPNVLSLRIRTI